MTIEALQDVVGTVIGESIILVPLTLVAACISFSFRERKWVAPLWTLLAVPNCIIIGLVLYLLCRTSAGSGPDWGFVGMGTGFLALGSLLEIIPGVLLLVSFPRRAAWSFGSSMASIAAATVAIGGIGILVRVAVVPPTTESRAKQLAEAYVLPDGSEKIGFRKRAFFAMLQDPKTPRSALEWVGVRIHPNSQLWYALASNPSIPESIIERRLSEKQIAELLARNPHLPAKYLTSLAESVFTDVRVCVARNIATPHDSLKNLSTDPDPIVRDFARQNLDGELGTFAYR